MSLIHYLAFESTLPPTDALISLGGCRSLLFSLYLDTKIPLVYESQIYRAFMGGNIRTECPVVLRPLRSAMRSEQYFTEFALAHFYKDASWTWCTDSGMPPQESRGICSPTQRDFVSLNFGGLSAKNALPRSAQSFRPCLYHEHLPSAFTRSAKSLADWAHQDTAVLRALQSMCSRLATGVQKCNFSLGNTERHTASTLFVLLCVTYAGWRLGSSCPHSSTNSHNVIEASKATHLAQ